MTRYEFFRKRIAPVLFLGMVGLIAYDTCHKQERTHATIVIDPGDVPVKSIDAELIVENEVIANAHCHALEGMRIGPCKFETAMPADAGTLRIEVDGKTLVKHVRPIEGGKITVSIGPDLR